MDVKTTSSRTISEHQELVNFYNCQAIDRSSKRTGRRLGASWGQRRSDQRYRFDQDSNGSHLKLLGRSFFESNLRGGTAAGLLG